MSKIEYCYNDTTSDCTLTNTYSIFLVLILVLIALWTIASFWVICLDLFFYKTLDFDITNTSDTFCVAVCITLLFVAITYFIKYSGIVPNLETRILGVGKDETKEKHPQIKGTSFEKVIDLTQNQELQGAIVPTNSVLRTLRAERLVAAGAL